ncbi:hypothetical protein F2Q69_00006323 [Brassica cretica]|uniref:Uncharacterized protein n=1 Tax=Brassica cretica TaxID=69181 RepID=A0A8S9P0K5_BRACR|nr:hypothetical protein F2Q69_00006323 [Brassica cretica]
MCPKIGYRLENDLLKKIHPESRMEKFCISSADGRTGRVFDPGRRMADLDWFCLADDRAGRVVDPARPSVELDWFSSADGRAGRLVDSAELDGVLCPPFNKTGISYATRC